jgi:hypothetical protein
MSVNSMNGLGSVPSRGSVFSFCITPIPDVRPSKFLSKCPQEVKRAFI